MSISFGRRDIVHGLLKKCIPIQSVSSLSISDKLFRIFEEGLKRKGRGTRVKLPGSIPLRRWMTIGWHFTSNVTKTKTGLKVFLSNYSNVFGSTIACMHQCMKWFYSFRLWCQTRPKKCWNVEFFHLWQYNKNVDRCEWMRDRRWDKLTIKLFKLNLRQFY
jgi:hypothetical protein